MKATLKKRMYVHKDETFLLQKIILLLTGEVSWNQRDGNNEFLNKWPQLSNGISRDLSRREQKLSLSVFEWTSE